MVPMRTLLAIGLVVCSASIIPGQAQQNGTLSGTVKDSQNLPVSGGSAEVQLKAAGSRRVTQTDETGHFQISDPGLGLG